MKIFLTLLLLIPSLSWGGEKYLDPKYSFKPEQDVKWAESTGALGGVYEITTNTPKNTPHAHAWVDDIVRDGKYAIRLERQGHECNDLDCKRGKFKGSVGRTEFGFWAREQVGENWFRWSVYIPIETNHISPAWTMFTQFKTNDKKDIKGCSVIPVYLQLHKHGIILGQDYRNCDRPKHLIIPNSENFKGKWLDFLMHSKWSDKDDGFITLWMNGEKVWAHTGPNMTDTPNQNPPIMRFPIYSGKLDKNYTGSQVFYFDAFYSAKKCEDMKLETLGYSCNDLVSKLYVPLKISLEELEKEEKPDCEPGRKLVFKEGTNIPEWIEVVCD